MEIVIGLARAPHEPPEPPPAAPERIVLERPTPTPTPKPTPPPIVHLVHPTLAPVPQIAAAKAPEPKATSHGGAKAAPAHHFHFKVYKRIKTSPAGKAVGITGTGTGISAGSGTGGDNGTTGTGNGTAGTGNGAVNANTPCGEVDFVPTGAPDYSRKNGSAAERIRATVRFPDGHQESDMFPYQWVYQNGEQDDPWSNTNLKRQVEIPLIFPPPGSDTSAYPPIIKYILDHTRPDGTTVLSDCPKPAR